MPNVPFSRGNKCSLTISSMEWSFSKRYIPFNVTRFRTNNNDNSQLTFFSLLFFLSFPSAIYTFVAPCHEISRKMPAWTKITLHWHTHGDDFFRLQNVPVSVVSGDHDKSGHWVKPNVFIFYFVLSYTVSTTQCDNTGKIKKRTSFKT